ncbi:type IV secretion system protein [Paracoccus sp. YLB-12]|uniref:Type IV secretion system protein n=1 Tax=Paracoccus maritimus TaxID=2933292 RepID=A0ABT2KFW4_9RHOB|nr:type IV secretion system protein [Paracoccus sp. YLB-12]MCT4334729.1 type IV secretion system protein [Paracoccus sp. YLB-12]
MAEILTGGLEMLAVLLIVLYGINVLFRFTEFSFPQLIGIMIRIGAIYMFLFSWDNFNIIYSSGTSLFDTVGNTVRDFVAGPASDTSGDAATNMFQTLAEVIDLVVNGNSVLVRALVGAFLFVVLGILAVIYILVVAYAKLLLAVLISIAPLMGFFLLFTRTRSMFEAWLAAVFGYLI